MGNGEHTVSAVELLLVDALSTAITRRMAERIVCDLRRNRGGLPLPSDLEGLLALVRGDLAQATFLRMGTRAPKVLAEVEERVLALTEVPAEAWHGPRVRLVYVGRNREAAHYLARELGAHPVIRVDEVFELLLALDSDERTLVAVDSDDTRTDAAVIARFVQDFPPQVLTFVASTSPATREAFLSSGAAFRATLRTEPMDHPDVPQMLRDLVRGESVGSTRRTRGGTSTTTEPARAA